MSYILEAIRRSEAQRQKKSHPESIRLLPAQQQKQISWRWLFVAVVALAAINIVTLAYFSQHAPKSVNKAGVSVVREGADAAELEPVTAPALSQQKGVKSSAPVSVERGALQPEYPSVSHHPHPKTESKRALTTSLPFPNARDPGFAQGSAKQASLPSSQTPSAKPVTPPLPSALDAPNDHVPRVLQPPKPVGAVPGDPTGSPASKEIPLFSELPSELRRRIPPIKINVHAYSQQPQEQFIIVGMVKYRPGEQIGNELVLEEVTRDGLVLRFQDQPFRLPRR
ncbi:MAG: general secretion pathway protein GspB [Gammaproteobacteria bacterium]